MPANILMKVVLPVPFSPSMTRISLSVNEPSSTSNLKLPCRVYRERHSPAKYYSGNQAKPPPRHHSLPNDQG